MKNYRVILDCGINEKRALEIRDSLRTLLNDTEIVLHESTYEDDDVAGSE